MYKNYLFLLCLLFIGPLAKIAACIPTITIAVSPNDTVCLGTMVTLTTTITDGGAAPTYKWYLNGAVIPGATGSTYSSNTINNYDIFHCVLTSNAPCANPTTATSNYVLMSVVTTLTPSISISTPSTTICVGASATFSASITNGGVLPQYQWKKNGANITGATNSSYYASSISNGEVFSCVYTAGASACVTTSTLASNNITMTVLPTVTPGVTIGVGPDSVICSGDTATFSATQTGGGAAPQYQWKKNGTAITGATGATYTTAMATNGDRFQCVLTSNVVCPAISVANSNTVTMSVSASIPNVTISANPGTTIPVGSIVTFTAMSTNGGSNPTYKWRVNGGYLAGAVGPTFSSGNLHDGDIIDAVLRSNMMCAIPDSAISNRDTIHIMPVGLSQIEGALNEIAVYPNPTNGKLSITSYKKGTLHIYSLLGQDVYQQAIPAGHSILNIDTLTPGIYISKFITANGKVAGIVRLVYEP